MFRIIRLHHDFTFNHFRKYDFLFLNLADELLSTGINMKSCPSQKKMYPSESVAIDALIEARTHFEFKLNQGPVAVYLCDDCSHYHLTSQGNMNARLAKYLNDGTLKRMKEASNWEKKFRR